MTSPSCSCRVGHLCERHLVDRQRVIGERLAYMNHRVHLRAVEPKPEGITNMTRNQRSPEWLEEQVRRGRSDLYSGIANAIEALANYGGYDDIDCLMSEYDPTELMPPQLSRYLELPNLETAQRFFSALITWVQTASDPRPAPRTDTIGADGG
ncbi:hypothetical protein A5714_01945 [Mycobacterium sp. E2462]|uniref:hypothetical protein n=1 Tax=Mycobacterium sp. E2462 TaxID=1834133 RepID=UPI0007FF5A6D|nr:hypothetical protein [Mycobacterium sp. E2462]OBI08556.1 hypothetical protein A5714_01945 [Mycobacterium sp. E2462]